MRLNAKFTLGLAISSLVAVAFFLASSHAGGVIGVQWNQIGPQPLQIDAEQNFQGAGPDSGEVTEIAIDPRGVTDSVIYLTSNDGGVWKSTDGGLTWKPKTDFLDSLSAGAVTLDRGNPSVVYYGTGNNFNNGFFKGIGVYKSTDAGDSWTLTAGSSVLNNRAIIRMLSPAANTLLVATNSGLYRSTDGGGTYSSVKGGFISDLRIDTASASTIRAAVSGSGIFVSTDGGATFPSEIFLANGGPGSNVGYIAFAQSTSPNGQTLYATVQNTNPTVSAPSRFLGMWKSTDGGGSWANLPAAGGVDSSPPTSGPGDQDGNSGSGCQCGYDQTIGVDPKDAGRVYIGFQELWLSTDGGGSFGSPAATLNQVHWDHHALVFSPPSHVSGGASTTPLYVGQDGGIAYTNDGAGTWTNLNGPLTGDGAIATNLFRGIDIGRYDSTRNKYTYGGTQDTGTVEFRPPFTNRLWHLGIDGDGGPVAVDPCNASVVLGDDDGGAVRSTNGGTTWGGPGGFPANSSVGVFAFDQTCDTTAYGAVFTAPGPSVPPTVFSIFVSTDDGANFSKMHDFSTGVSAIATVKLDPNVVWAGFGDGTLQYTTNALAGASATWTAVSVPGIIAGQPVTSIAIDPSNTDTVVVTYPGFSGVDPDFGRTKHVFMTTNRGTAWTDISGLSGGGIGNLPDLPVYSAVIDGTTIPHTIIVSNDAGVLQSADLGNSWQVLGLGMPAVMCPSLALDSSASPSLLRVGTYGRSVFELGPATGPLLQINTNLGFGNVCASQKPTQIVQLFNVGSTDLHISSFTRVSGSADFSLISGPATPVTLTPGEEIDYTIQFAPSDGPGAETATFQINSDDQFQPAQQLVFTATVTSPTIGTVIANSGQFGDVCVGSFSDLNLTITNNGKCNLSISNIASTSTNFKLASVVSFPIVVAPGGSVSIPIRFQPASFGAKSGSINVSSNDPTTPVASVPVLGNAPPGKITVSGSTTFGNVCAGSNAQQTVTVGNVGLCDLHVTGASINCSDFTIQNSPFPNTLSPDSSLPLTIAFTPTSGGAKSCTLTITSDDPTNPTVTFNLTGTTPPVAIDVPPDQGFPATVIQSVGACSSSAPFPVANDGTCPLTISSVAIGGTNASDYALSGLPSLPTSLQSGHTLGDGNLNTLFKPTAISRARTGTLTVTYESDPITHATTPVTRNLCGEGVSTGVRVLVTSGGVPLAQVKKIQLNRLGSNRKSISVDNVTNAPLQTVAQTAPCASFQFHREWGGVTNPIQLTTGDYQVTVSVTIGGKNMTKTVSFTLGTCSFNQNVVVNF